jgi:hypothetical protein
MTERPWLKFYPPDWRADPALRVCCLGARGLWLEMLCLMHEAEPRGTLRVNGRPMTHVQLAALVGSTPKDVQRYLDELEAAGVFSRDESGVMFSRRMVRDTEKAERDKANGGRGGNPTLKPQDKARVNPSVNGKDKAHIPEPEPEKKKKDPSGPKKASRLPESWRPAPGGIEYAEKCGLSTGEIDREIERFRNHWQAKAGRDAAKLDWDATWRNWVLKAAEILGRSPKPSGNGKAPERSAFGEVIDWRKRIAWSNEHAGEWPESLWGPREDVPAEFEHLFGEGAAQH